MGISILNAPASSYSVKLSDVVVDSGLIRDRGRNNSADHKLERRDKICGIPTKNRCIWGQGLDSPIF